MEAVAGVFASPAAAGAAAGRLRADGIDAQRIALLMPGTSDREAERRVPIDDAESPGMGGALGGVVGGALGLATASAVLPGVGPIVVAGVLAAGLAGAAGGAVVGDRVEEQLSPGLPRDELGVYQNVLRKGRSVAIVTVDTDEQADLVREIFRAAGAESVDPARADWMVGLRPPP